MQTDYKYYFKNYEDNEIFKELVKEIKNVWEIRDKAKDYLKREIEDKCIKVNKATVLGNINLIGNYYIDEGTKIYSGVTIEGPVYIGKNVEIKPGAYIRPGSIISDNCSIGFNSEIKSAVLQKGAKVASLAFVGDSILGKSARIGSGVITANRRFDQDTIKVKIYNEKEDTKTDYFGLVIGDNSRIGANSASFPGTFIGPYTWIFPLTQVHGFIPELKKVSNKKEMIFSENEKKELK